MFAAANDCSRKAICSQPRPRQQRTTPGPGKTAQSSPSRTRTSILDQVRSLRGHKHSRRAILPHLDAAYNFARWLTQDPIVAEDIVEDACLRAMQYFESFGGESGRAWLLRIVRTTAYTKLHSLEARMEVSDVADPDPGPETVLGTIQEHGWVKAAVAALPINLRECLLLHDIEELSYEEIAQVAEVPIGTVMSRLCRARRMLMACIGSSPRHGG
jgi:RNA polymerase sigma factor (sigma-70 family)